MDSTSFQSILAAVKRKREEEGGGGGGGGGDGAGTSTESNYSLDTTAKDNEQVKVNKTTPPAQNTMKNADKLSAATATTTTSTTTPAADNNNMQSTASNKPKTYREVQEERRERILSNKGRVENSKNSTHVQRKFEKYRKIVVSKSQTGNPLLKHLRIEYSINARDLDVDYGINSHCYLLYLTLSYHNTNPGYIENRLRRVRGDRDPTRIRVLLCVVDVQNHEKPLRDLARMCIGENFSLLVAWSPAEAANYIAYLKQCEAGVGTSIIRGNTNSTQANDQGDGKLKLGGDIVNALTAIRSINKRDAVALATKYGSVGNLVQRANEEELAEVAGMGRVKVRDFLRVVNEPFVVRRG